MLDSSPRTLLINRIEAAVEGGATSMLFTVDELRTVHNALQDSVRLILIVENWRLDIDEVRALTDMAIEAMPLNRGEQ